MSIAIAFTLATETADSIASLETILAQLKRCIEDGDHEDSAKWASTLENQASDLWREIMASWENGSVAEATADLRIDWRERAAAMRRQA